MISRLIKISLIGAGFLLVAGISAYFTLTYIIKGEETVVVPALVGEDVVTVLQRLTELGLNTKVKGSEFSGEIPANHVLFQEPRPGAEIKKDRDVRIVISKGPKQVMVPNLAGLPFQNAQIILDENGLCLKNRSYTFSETVAREDIMAQAPEAGATIDRNSCVDLLISAGSRPPAFKMPDLNGRSLEEAFIWMETVKLRVGKIKAVFQKNRPFDTVVGQIPPAGYRVPEGSQIDLHINRSPDDAGRQFAAGRTGVGLFRYRLRPGFLKRHIRIRLNGYGGSHTLMDDMVSPGEEVWHLIPDTRDAAVMLYEDGELKESIQGEALDRMRSDPDAFAFTISDDRFPFLKNVLD